MTSADATPPAPPGRGTQFNHSESDSMNDPFVTCPPAQSRKLLIPVLRSNKKFGLKQTVLCLSDKIICCPTHHTTRTHVCDDWLGKTCQLCEKGVVPRWLGYLGCWSQTRKGKFLLELTHMAALKLAEKAEALGSLRGYTVQIERAGDKPNGELLVRCAHLGQDDEQVPESFDVRLQLRRMWGLDDGKPQVVVTTQDDPRIAGDFNADIIKHRKGVA